MTPPSAASDLLLDPSDLGLPRKFARYYPSQVKTILDIAEQIEQRRFALLSAPTGSGKSAIYLSVAAMLGVRTLVLVGTKQLQEQLMIDFAEMGMVDVRGQSNYRCVALDRGGILEGYGPIGSTCEAGPCHIGVKCDHRFATGCLYYDAQARAKNSRIVVTNYAYWLTLGRYSDPEAIGTFGLIVLDEAHTAPDWLVDFVSVEPNRTEMRALVHAELPSIDDGIAAWALWARTTLAQATAVYEEGRAALKAMKKSNPERAPLTRRLLRIAEIIRDLSGLANAHDWQQGEPARRNARLPGGGVDWVSEPTERGAHFAPIWAHAYAEQLMFRNIPRVILSSATLPPQIGKYLGIDPKQSTYHEVGSSFDPRRRPFIYIPTVRVDHRMVEGQVRMWVNRIDQIIDGRLDRKGIIHTRSYARAKEIYARSRHRGIMMIHSSRDTHRVIEQFRKAAAPCVLLSPSVEEGHDFVDDTCRYQIIAKVPFLDGRGSLAKARMKSDKEYSSYTTALTVTQMAGRSTRTAGDWSETFVIDDHWNWFRNHAKKHMPRWFQVAWRQSANVPPPLAPPKG